jgi:hypothetical protein
MCTMSIMSLWGKVKEREIKAYFNGVSRRLESVDGDDLLEAIEGDQHKGVVQLVGVGLCLGNVVNEETVKGYGLAIDNVAMVGPLPTTPTAAFTTRALPVFSQ